MIGIDRQWRKADNMIGRKALDRIADVDPVGPWSCLSFSTCIRASLQCWYNCLSLLLFIYLFIYLFIVISHIPNCKSYWLIFYYVRRYSLSRYIIKIIYHLTIEIEGSYNWKWGWRE